VLDAQSVRLVRQRPGRYQARGDVWMQVKRPMLRRLLAVQEVNGKPETLTSVARRADVSRSLLSMLASGERKTCSPKSAIKIAAAFGFKDDLGKLFVTEVASVTCDGAKHEGEVA
jgi:transcriptional regulator with XRE-family HTH domain